MNSNLQELQDGTRAKNIEIQRRLDEVWSSTLGFEAKLRTEAQEAAESIQHIKRDYEKHIRKFETSILAEMRDIFDRVDKKLVVVQNDRVAAQETGMVVYFSETVPLTVERQSGEVSRQLKKQYETFDIERQKGKKR